MYHSFASKFENLNKKQMKSLESTANQNEDKNKTVNLKNLISYK